MYQKLLSTLDNIIKAASYKHEQSVYNIIHETHNTAIYRMGTCRMETKIFFVITTLKS